MIHRPSSTIRIETPRGFALVDSSITPAVGNKVAWQVDGYPMIGKFFRTGIVTEEGRRLTGSHWKVW
ncbi:hypothetical protein ACFQUX_22740 [Pantoea stewartii]